jgi:hypothetical protein
MLNHHGLYERLVKYRLPGNLTEPRNLHFFLLNIVTKLVCDNNLDKALRKGNLNHNQCREQDLSFFHSPLFGWPFILLRPKDSVKI